MKPLNVSTMHEMLSSMLWDTVILDEHSTDIRFFNNPLGATAKVVRNYEVVLGTKNYSETNMYANSCDPTKDHSIKYISIDIEPVKKTDKSDQEKENIRKFGILEFKIIDKRICICPLSVLELPTFEDIFNFMDRASQYPDLLKAYNGDLIKLCQSIIDRKSFSFNQLILIPRYTTFDARMYLPFDMCLSTPFMIRVILHGWMKRPI